MSRRTVLLVASIAGSLVLTGCGGSSGGSHQATKSKPPTSTGSTPTATQTATTAPTSSAAATGALPGMPAVLDPHDIYAADRPGMLSPVVAHDRPLIYVPNSGSNTVDEIDPTTYRIVRHFAVGRLPQHVVPSWDLKTLWVNNDQGNSLTPIDPTDGVPGTPVPVDDPYNLYFTPDGRYAIVMAERLRRIDFRDPHTMALHDSTPVPCRGVNHADFSADGRYFIASCEFDGHLLKVDTVTHKVIGTLLLAPGAMPQDVKTSPDGSTFFVADMASNGVWMIDGATFRVRGFVPTGKGAHGLYITRDSRDLIVTNRGEGSLSLYDFAAGRVVKKIWIPGGGSPDMGGVSADGKVFWVSGRYNSVVYAISIPDGKLLAKIPVGTQPHGLCVFPQPGRYSLGHTGVFR